MEKLYSKILEHGYINIYSDLSAQERRQVHFKTLYKSENPGWDDSLIFLTNRFREFLKPNLTVLDAGCGNGNYIIDENRAGITHAVGIDVAKEFVQKNICLVYCLDKALRENRNWGEKNAELSLFHLLLKQTF